MPTWKVRDKVNDIFLSIEEKTKDLAKNIDRIILTLHQTESGYINLDAKLKSNILTLMSEKLNESNFISGAGFASLLDIKGANYKSWQVLWLYRPDYQKKSGRFILNKTSQPLLDYQTFEWFTKANRPKKGYLHGPYVDYICNTNYTLTYVYPIYLGNNFIGVAAIDLLVGRLEHDICQAIAESSTKLVITTATKRVLFSNHSDYRVGELATFDNTPPHEINDYFTCWILADDRGA